MRALLWLTLALPALADQTDPRLDGLFEQLAAAESPGAAQPIIDQIWPIWLAGPEAVEQALARGMAAMRYGDYGAADEAFSAAIALAPDHAETWNKRATVRYLMGNLAGSLADIERVLALEPRHFGALEGRGLIYVAQGRPAEALAAFEQVLEIHPTAGAARGLVERLRAEVLGEEL